MTKSPLNFLTVAGTRAMIEYRGMRRVCSRCGGEGHIRAACNAVRCGRCGAYGHVGADCRPVCKRCGGAHPTLDCVRPRSYAAAVAAAAAKAPQVPGDQPGPAESSQAAGAVSSGAVEDAVPSLCSLTSRLLESAQHVLLGDFICVLDTLRDIPGPSQGASNYHAKELGDLVRQLHLTDALVELHGDLFVATRARGRSARRIDRVYLPAAIVPHLESYEMMPFPPGVGALSDHVPVASSLRCASGRIASPSTWRMDVSFFADDLSIRDICADLALSIAHVDEFSPLIWDALKAQWRELLTRAVEQNAPERLLHSTTFCATCAP
ncbi:uncharacterized protein LOC144102133 [Amblyomma americanum]